MPIPGPGFSSGIGLPQVYPEDSNPTPRVILGFQGKSYSADGYFEQNRLTIQCSQISLQSKMSWGQIQKEVP